MNACAGRLCINLVVFVAALTTGCEDPKPVPQDSPKPAASVHAAVVTAAAPSAPPEPPEPPLVAQPFVAGAAPSLCTPAKAEGCALDAIGGTTATDLVTVEREGETMFVGWAADDTTVPPVVLVELVGAKKTFHAAATRRTKRPDVAAAAKAPALVHSGYDLLASLNDVDAGEYSVQVAQITSTGKALLCNTRRKVKVE